MSDLVTLLCCLLTMQIYSDSTMIFLRRINGYAHFYAFCYAFVDIGLDF